MLAGGQNREADGAFGFLRKRQEAGAGDLSGDNEGDEAGGCNKLSTAYKKFSQQHTGPVFTHRKTLEWG